MSEQREGRKARSAREVRFTIANPDVELSDEAIDALARLLLSLSRQSQDQQEIVAA